MMKTKLTRIHLGLGMPEIGVQFEATGDDGIATTQRAFIVVPDDALASVWLAAQAALDAKLGELPLDIQPGAVTTALMKQRTAEAAAKKAQEAVQAAGQKKAAVEAEAARITLEATQALAEVEALRAKALADVDAAVAQKATVEAEIAQARAASVESAVQGGVIEP